MRIAIYLTCFFMLCTIGISQVTPVSSPMNQKMSPVQDFPELSYCPNTDLLWSVAKLNEELSSSPDLVVLDCRKKVFDFTGALYVPYDIEHIEGAYYINHFVFGDPYPHDLLEIITCLSELGIERDSPICLYDAGIANPQGKVFFNLDRLGCTNVHILDGGFTAWKSASGPVSSDPTPAATPSVFIPEINEISYAETDDMKTVFDMVQSGSNDYCLLDNREDPFYYGHKIAPDVLRHGHLRYSTSCNWKSYFDASGFLKSPMEIDLITRAAGGDPRKVNVLIGTKGWRTGMTYFILRYAGWPKKSLLNYVGGVRDWSYMDAWEYPLDSEACYRIGAKMPDGTAYDKRFAGASVQVGERAYCIGGFVVSSEPTKNVEASDRNQAFDFTQTDLNDQWQSNLAPLPEPLVHCTGAGLNGYAFVIGGQNADYEITDVVYRYDTLANSWSTMTSLPSARYSAAAAAIPSQNKIYVSGGVTGPSSEPSSYSDDLFVYDASSNTWDGPLSAKLPSGRRSHSMVAVDHTLYIAGGFYYKRQRSTNSAASR